VSDDRFDTTDPTGASTKKHGCLLSRPVESSAQVGKSKKEGAQISLQETTMEICLWQNLSIMTLLSLLMGVWQNVCKELTVLLMLPNKLLQILRLDFYTL
jgi:hypothetical protein